MNGIPPTNPTGSTEADNDAPENGETATLHDRLLGWAKRFLWCNPFYLASAALLLFGISRLTESPDLADESAQMFFNFGSLQLYETLLIGTAILLVRRCIWYDATLLVFLDSLLALVPFILVSQAAFLGDGETWLVCATGGVLVVSRFLGLKVFYPRLNLPFRLLGCGAVLLVVNIALPLIFKHEHQLSPDDAAANLSFHGWVWLMPLLMALGNQLPRPRHGGTITPERSWLPAGLFAIWVLVSGYHLFRLGYIYDLKWNIAMLAPVLWVAAWTLYRRLTDFVAEPRIALRTTALWIPAGITLLAILHSDSSIFFALSSLNAAIYGAKYLRDRANGMLFQLALLSVAASLAGMPEACGRIVLPEFDRTRGIVLGAGANALFQTILSRTPQIGIIGAFVLGAGTVALFPDADFVWYFAFQSSLVFLLLHSLRWNDGEHHGAALIRVLTALMWVGHSIFWVQQSDVREAWPITLFAVAVLGGYVIARFVIGQWGPQILPIASFITLIIIPGRMGIDLIQRASIGLMALVGSIVLFAVGTVLAWTKDKWHRPDSATAAK